MPEIALCTYGQGIGAVAHLLFEHAQVWARGNWPPQLPWIYTIEMNPCLLRDCPCVTRFLQGIGLANGSGIENLSTFFAFHGTTLAAAQNICCQGWQPSRRRSTNAGYGEFFGLNPTISHGYCKGSNCMVVALIVRNGCISEVNGQYAIVLNPKSDTAPCYCLPIAVISFGCYQGMTWSH
jgi:hypothetical protein